jgi:hypothetical protein
MSKRQSRSWAGVPRDALLVVLVIATTMLAGVAGAALADDNTSAATREFANHIANHNTVFRR